MLKEEYRPIEGFPNYAVSNFGTVMNTKFGYEKALVDDGRGYYKVDLYNHSKRTTRKVHRLVADAFLPPDPERREINHKDGNKKNNCVDNLERCTGKENMAHAFLYGLSKPIDPYKYPHTGMKGKKNPNGGLHKPVKVLETGKIYDSRRDCARDLNLSDRAICECLLCRQKSHRGYHFENV